MGRTNPYDPGDRNRAVHALGINHIALEVGNIGEALEFYGKLFELKLRGRTDHMAFIDMGDQFIALAETRSQPPDRARHFGLVVDNRDLLRRRLEALDVPLLPGPFMDFLDPWGNHIQVVQYSDVQFTKAENILRGMGLESLNKTEEALRELKERGMAPA